MLLQAYLVDRQLVQKKQPLYFIRWASNYLSFLRKIRVSQNSRDTILNSSSWEMIISYRNTRRTEGTKKTRDHFWRGFFHCKAKWRRARDSNPR
ncbi:MAG: hypothetical protein CVU68_03300 [Deltaproteobacteria bacterium HGW-Deltaproteobacteria-3]|nr:MAG: hypothetical protein CVU68_03300 [Deltaproteobacteria bacterium HGW-Deltaproteobacteria-3]